MFIKRTHIFTKIFEILPNSVSAHNSVWNLNELAVFFNSDRHVDCGGRLRRYMEEDLGLVRGKF